MQQKNINISTQRWVVIIGTLLLGGKFVAYWLTNSTTILTDALESIINVVAGLLGLYSLIISALPKDQNHPYGHGKIEFISAGVEGTLIAIAGVTIIIKAVHGFFHPHEMSRLDWGIFITALAGGINYFMGYLVERRGRKAHSIALTASGKHLKSDAYSSVGVVVGLAILYFTNLAWLDNAIALIFGGLIGWTGYGIIKESVAGIMDEVDFSLVEEIVDVLNTHRHENWMDIHNLRVIKYGNALHIDCHLTVPWYFNTIEAHQEVDRLEELLTEQSSSPIEFFVHVDACVPTSCFLCRKTDCPQRMENYKMRVEWTPQNIMMNRKHGLIAYEK